MVHAAFLHLVPVQHDLQLVLACVSALTPVVRFPLCLQQQLLPKTQRPSAQRASTAIMSQFRLFLLTARNSLYPCSTFVPLSGLEREIPSSVTTEPLSSAVAYQRNLFDCRIDRDGCTRARRDTTTKDLAKQAGQDLQDTKSVPDIFADCM